MMHAFYLCQILIAFKSWWNRSGEATLPTLDSNWIHSVQDSAVLPTLCRNLEQHLRLWWNLQLLGTSETFFIYACHFSSCWVKLNLWASMMHLTWFTSCYADCGHLDFVILSRYAVKFDFLQNYFHLSSQLLVRKEFFHQSSFHLNDGIFLRISSFYS